MDNEVRKKMAFTPGELMRDFLDGDIGDEKNHIYSGIVINNNDPDNQGKCQIRVYSIYGNDIPDKDLPWALPDFSFVGSSVGNFTVPPVGAIVNVYFDKGDIYFPHYTTKAVRNSRLPTRRMKNYPDNIVLFETDNGDYFEIDRKNSTATFYHKSGTKISILSNGSVEIDCKGQIFNIKNAQICEISGEKQTNLGKNASGDPLINGVIYSTNGSIPVDAEGRPIQGIAVSNNVTVGG